MDDPRLVALGLIAPAAPQAPAAEPVAPPEPEPRSAPPMESPRPAPLTRNDAPATAVEPSFAPMPPVRTSFAAPAASPLTTAPAASPVTAAIPAAASSVAPPLAAPVAVQEDLVAAIAGHSAAIRKDIRLGLFWPAQLVMTPRGFALIRWRGKVAYAWSEVKEIKVSRGAVLIKTEADRERVVKTKEGPTTRQYVERRTHTVQLKFEGTPEPHVAAEFARVLEDMRAARFSFGSTSWHELENALERIRGQFADQDDPIVPAAAATLWIFLGVMSLIVVPEAVNLATDVRPATGAFAIQPRYEFFDPRTIIAAFALSALLTRLVLRVALAEQADIWARGTLRGWHTAGSRRMRFASKQLARVLLGTTVAAALVLVCVGAFLPTAASTVTIDAAGIRQVVPLPFVGLDRGWNAVLDVIKTPSAERLQKFGVTIRFADGREVTTVGRDLAGGTDGQLFERATAWRGALR